MAEDVAHSTFKAGLVVHVLAIVVTKALLVKVAKEVEGFDAHIRSVDSTLQQAPEVFEAVGMNPTIHILDSMVYDLMSILPSQTIVGEQKVRVECRSRFNMLLHFGLKRVFLAVRNYGRANLPAPFQDAHDGSFVFSSRSGDATGAFGKVHVAGLAADERLVSLNLTGEFRNGVVMQCHADAVKHEPSGLLSYSEGTGDFAGANAVLAIAKNPVSAHPLIEAERGILEDSSHLEAELLLAPRAEPDLAGFDKGMLLRTAARAANNPVREPQIERVLESAVSVREVDDGLLECVRGFHSSNLRSNALCVKYVIALIRGGIRGLQPHTKFSSASEVRHA